MGQWWSGLGDEGRSWFIMFGILALFVGGILVGVVGCVNWPVLEPLVHIGFGTALASVIGGFVTAMVRFS